MQPPQPHSCCLLSQQGSYGLELLLKMGFDQSTKRQILLLMVIWYLFQRLTKDTELSFTLYHFATIILIFQRKKKKQEKENLMRHDAQ